jgi:t-SNARE complex subunit (syntaxin)
MTSHPSMFKADHYSAIRQSELTKTTKRDKCTTTFGFRNGKSCKAGKHHRKNKQKKFVIIIIIIIIIIILFSSNATLIFNSGSARLESRTRYWLS